MRFNIDRKQFIEEVKNRPLLWNHTEHQFVNKAMASLLWEEVGVICGTSGVLAKSIWKNLKDQYRKEHGKMQKNKYKRLWVYYDQMSFMKEFIVGALRSRLKVSNTSKKKEIEISNEYENEDSHNTEEIDNHHVEENDEIEELIIKDEPEETIDMQEYHQEIVLENPTNRLENYEEQNKLTLLHNRIPQKRLYVEGPKGEVFILERVEKKPPQPPLENDGDLQFFKSLLPYMESFTPLEKLEARTKIQQIVLEKYSEKCKNGSV